MIRNYLKIAWRNLSKNKIYSFINIGGLAIGLAVSYQSISAARANPVKSLRTE
jgi:hypothetical protein